MEDLPVPYLIVEYVEGVDLERRRHRPTRDPEVWVEVGRNLARLHVGTEPAEWPRADAPLRAGEDIVDLLAARTADGWFSYVEEEWLTTWVGRLRDGLSDAPSRAPTHGDVQMSNILVDANGRYAALLDWGCASVKDPVVDFMPMPFAAVPPMLAGHRDIAPLPDDDTAERRILVGRLRTLLQVLPRGAAPGMTWGERPTAWLTDLLRFFQDPPTDTWRALAPSR